MMKELSFFDLAILRQVHLNGAPRWLVDSFVALSFLGSGWMLLALLPMFAFSNWRRFAAALLGTTAITAAMVAGIKVVVGRVRPCNALAWCPAVSIHAPTDYSFPSGHAAGSFAVAMVIFRLDRRAGALAWVWAALVALSRVALGVHYPSDVIVGAFVGSAVGAVGAGWVLRAKAGAHTLSSGASRQGSAASSGST